MEPDYPEIVHLPPSIGVVVINGQAGWLIEQAHGDIAILLAPHVLLPCDFENGVITLDLLRDVVNGMLIFVGHPKVTFEVNIPIIAPKKHRRLVFIIRGRIVPVFNSCPVVVRNGVESVRGLSLPQWPYRM